MEQVPGQEYPFQLPIGYEDGSGKLQRNGLIRRATKADKQQALEDPRVKQDAAYLAVILLSRVVTKLGDLDAVNAEVIEGLGPRTSSI